MTAREIPPDEPSAGSIYARRIDVTADSPWLSRLQADAEEEARRRADAIVGPDHLALAFTAGEVAAAALLKRLGVDPLSWRDEINWMRGRNQAHDERDSVDPPVIWESPAERRHEGDVVWSAGARLVLSLAREEAGANDDEVGPAHLLVGLLLEIDSVGAGTAYWHGLRPGRVREEAGLRNEARAVAGGAAPPPGAGARPTRRGPVVLHGGGGVSAEQLATIVALAPRRHGGAMPGPSVVVVDLGWLTHRPVHGDARHGLPELHDAGAGSAAASGLVEREDAFRPDVCEQLAAADLIWFRGGHCPSIFDRLWATPALDAIREASDAGAVVGGSSAGAAVWSVGTVSDFASTGGAESFPLFGWLDDLVVFGHYFPSREAAFRRRLAVFPGCRGLAIAHRGAVVVEPGWARLHTLHSGVHDMGNFTLAHPDAPLAEVVPRPTDVSPPTGGSVLRAQGSAPRQ